MELTFSLRRKEIVQDQPLVSTIKQRWPGLFFEEQVYAEFSRINQIDLKSTFLTTLDNVQSQSDTRGDSQMKELIEKLDAQCSLRIKFYGGKCGSTIGRRMDNLGDFIKAFILLFGLLYALNIEYPKDLKYTFEAVQKIFVNLGSEFTERVQSLKNKLLQL
ncbi:hypothetical protein QTP70_014163 [Hemibagrus guttatus]|uniref:Uncharacterized protein n=1 Tax=Hemibagrus guttatus TaxID=175788 RepID=A0AAE0QQC3_9TELE|nr:hypothetical protein QTP70_014163 [Hemibagrus guttatus]